MFKIPGKKMLSIIVSLSLIVPLFVFLAAAPALANDVFSIGSTTMTVNGTAQTMDVAPYIKDGRTFLPLRYVAEAMGIPDSSISFNNGQIVINNNGTMVVLNIGSTTMLVGGASVTMDTPPEVTNGRTCLPIAWVAMALNANCQWDANTQQVTITANGTQQVTTGGGGGQVTTPTSIPVSQPGQSQAPTTPTGIQTNTTNNSITISWNPVYDATDYIINYDICQPGGQVWSGWNSITTASTNYTFSNLTTNSSFECDIAATNSSGQQSQPSNAVSYEIVASSPNIQSSPPEPTIMPDGGTFSNQVIMTITTIPGDTTYFTTDGSDPETSSTRGQTNGSFTLGISATVNAAIEDPNGNWSSVASATFIINSSPQPTVQPTPSIPSQQTTITLAPYDSNNVEVNTYTWSYQGKQFSWQIGVPENLVQNEAFNQVPKLLHPSIWKLLTNPASIIPQTDFDPLIDDSASAQYISGVASELNQTSDSQGYDWFHEAEFIANFVQTIPYIMVTGNVEYPPQVIANGGDCVNKAMLLASILKQRGYPVAVLVFPQANHAVCGIGFSSSNIPSNRGNMTYYTKNGINYYFTDATNGSGCLIGEDTVSPSFVPHIYVIQ